MRWDHRDQDQRLSKGMSTVFLSFWKTRLLLPTHTPQAPCLTRLAQKPNVLSTCPVTQGARKLLKGVCARIHCELRCVGPAEGLGEPALPLLTVSGQLVSPSSSCLARGAEGDHLRTEPTEAHSAPPSEALGDDPQHLFTLMAFGHSGLGLECLTRLGKLPESVCPLALRCTKVHSWSSGNILLKFSPCV